ncbi:MAG TPA: TonB-dependent receptor [Rhodothermales bacterium]|nr:TonB-dependent receptor [Rhodothermales bacterium]
MRSFWISLAFLVRGPAILVLFAALATAAYGQTASLRGFVTDASDGQPLQGVNVVLTNDAGAFLGAAADVDGIYSISRIPPGTYALRATSIGYAAYADTLTLATGELRSLNIALRPADVEVGEVVVEAEKETAGAAAISAGLQTIRPSDIEMIPAPDVSGDLVNYLGVLPGVVTAGDRGGQLFIRGGEPTQNLVLLDNMLIYQPFHIVGFYSAFPSDVISSVDLYAGGFGGKYGGRISSVMDITSRHGNKRRFAGAVSAAPYVSTIKLEGPLWKNRVSFLVSGRKSVIEQGAARLVDQPLPFDFDDEFAKIHANISRNSQLSFSAIRTFDRGTIGEPELFEGRLTTDQVSWKNEAFALNYLLLPANFPARAEITIAKSSIENAFGPAVKPLKSSTTSQYAVGANVTHYAGFVDLNWGVFLRASSLDSKLGGQFQNITTELEFNTDVGFYIEPEIQLGEKLRVQPGIRIHSFPSKSRSFVEPRFRAVWNLGVHRVSAAWGIYHQEIVGLNDQRDVGNVFTAWTSSPLGTVPEAMHFIGGYRIAPTPWLSFSLEGYYKTLSDLMIAEWTAFPRFTTSLQPADGRIRGADVRLELVFKSFYSFIGYGLADVQYDARQRSIRHWYGEQARTFHPSHDRRHQVNALGVLDLFGFDLSVRWQFGSGLPYTQALGFDEFILLAGPTDVLKDPGRTRVLYGQPYKGRLPAYHRLDVSLEREASIGSNVGLTLQAGLINAYDRANLFYLDLFTLRRMNQLPLIPSFGLKLEFN